MICRADSALSFDALIAINDAGLVELYQPAQKCRKKWPLRWPGPWAVADQGVLVGPREGTDGYFMSTMDLGG